MARPTMPAGYRICAYTPNNVSLTGASEEDSALGMSFMDWTVKEYVGDDDDFLYYYFISQTSSDTFWAWPVEVDCSSTGSSHAPTTSTTKLKIKEIQNKLNYYYKEHPYYPLVVDGVFGPKTCFAAYGYQKKVTTYKGSNLTGEFFTKLGLPEVYTTHFKSSCASWFGDEIPDDVPPPPPPVPSAPFPWLEMLIGAAGGTLVGLAGKKTVLKKQKKVKSWHAGVGGALLGALGGFIAGKMRQ